MRERSNSPGLAPEGTQDDANKPVVLRETRRQIMRRVSQPSKEVRNAMRKSLEARNDLQKKLEDSSLDPDIMTKFQIKNKYAREIV